MNVTERNRYAEVVIEQTRTELQHDGVVKHLGSFADKLIDYTDQLFVPNIKNDKLIIPKEYSEEDKYPLVVVEAGSKIIVPSMEPSPSQLDVIKSNVDKQGYRGSIPELLEKFIQDVIKKPVDGGESCSEYEMRDRSLGRMMRSSFKYPLAGDREFFRKVPNSDYLIFGRPSFAIRFLPNQDVVPGNLAHELTHLDQVIRSGFTPVPTDYNAEYLCDELEAHHTSGVIMLRAIMDGRITLDKINDLGCGLSIQVEFVLRNFADPNNPFDASPEIVKELRKMGNFPALQP